MYVHHVSIHTVKLYQSFQLRLGLVNLLLAANIIASAVFDVGDTGTLGQRAVT